MSKAFSKKLYKSKEWQSVRLIVISMQFNICNRCDNPIEEVHHKTYLTPDNINDADITLSIANLEGLCKECHLKEHGVYASKSEWAFDSEGNPTKRKDKRDV